MRNKIHLSFLFGTAFPVLLGIVLLAYVVARAIMLPITHDESNTCLTYSTMTIHDIVTYAVPIPNNHILNTLLVKFFSFVFGMHPLPVRLDNVLGFILYFIIIFLFSRKITNDPIVFFCGICVMTCNPYLLDFFSLARGYALSISFMLTSMYFAYLFLDTRRLKNLIWSVLLGAIAVYTNFTTLNFYVALTGMLIYVILEKYILEGKKEGIKFTHVLTQLFIIISVAILLAGASYLPISKMVETNQFTFGGQNGFYNDTVLSLLHSLQYNVQYFGMNEHGFSYLIITFILGMLLSLIPILKKNKGRLSAAPVFFFLLFAGTITVNIMQFYLIQTPFLITRTALFLFPLMAINIIFFADYLYKHFSRSRIYFSLMLSILFLVHFLRAANFYNTFEWWYDADTYTILNYLQKERPDDHSAVSLNTDWLFFPSFDFHKITESKDWLKLAPFHTEVWPDSSYEYYYATSDDRIKLDSNYTTVLSFGWDSRLLMKKK